MSLVKGKEYYLYGIKEHGFFYKLRYGDPEPHKTELFSIATNLGRPDIRGGIAISSDLNTDKLVRFTVCGDWVISVNNPTILESIKQLYLSSKTVDEQIENLLYITSDLIINKLTRNISDESIESDSKTKLFAKDDIEIWYCGPDNNFKEKSLLEIRQGDLIKVISSYSFGRQSKEFNDPTLLLGMLLEGFV